MGWVILLPEILNTLLGGRFACLNDSFLTLRSGVRRTDRQAECNAHRTFCVEAHIKADCCRLVIWRFAVDVRQGSLLGWFDIQRPPVSCNAEAQLTSGARTSVTSIPSSRSHLSSGYGDCWGTETHLVSRRTSAVFRSLISCCVAWMSLINGFWYIYSILLVLNAMSFGVFGFFLCGLYDILANS